MIESGSISAELIEALASYVSIPLIIAFYQIYVLNDNRLMAFLMCLSGSVGLVFGLLAENLVSLMMNAGMGALVLCGGLLLFFHPIIKEYRLRSLEIIEENKPKFKRQKVSEYTIVDDE
jgi:hypothetical protein